jgi:hypothetical protein
MPGGPASRKAVLDSEVCDGRYPGTCWDKHFPLDTRVSVPVAL